MAVGQIAGSRGIAFLVGATLMADMVAKACSSPQTAEINANKRAETLMKWVNVGLIEGAVFIVIAAVLEPDNRNAFLAGGALEGTITYYEYQYAKKSGLSNPGPSTEENDKDGVYQYSQA